MLILEEDVDRAWRRLKLYRCVGIEGWRRSGKMVKRRRRCCIADRSPSAAIWNDGTLQRFREAVELRRRVGKAKVEECSGVVD